MGLAVRGIDVLILLYAGHTSTHKDIELKPNPGYGMRVPHESHIHTWDDTHNSSGTTTDIYDYVMK